MKSDVNFRETNFILNFTVIIKFFMQNFYCFYLLIYVQHHFNLVII